MRKAYAVKKEYQDIGYNSDLETRGFVKEHKQNYNDYKPKKIYSVKNSITDKGRITNNKYDDVRMDIMINNKS